MTSLMSTRVLRMLQFNPGLTPKRPVSIRLVQIACYKSVSAISPAPLSTPITTEPPKTAVQAPKVGWKGWEEMVRLIPGATIEETQKSNENLFPKQRSGKKVTLLVFLGGCTFTEIAAVRFLAQQYEGREFLILTTHITNGSAMINSLVESPLLSK